MGKTISSGSANPEEVILEFSKALDGFINQTVQTLKSVKIKHSEMSNFWKGEQYDRFTQIIDHSLVDANKELLRLNEIKAQLDKKALILKEARKK